MKKRGSITHSIFIKALIGSLGIVTIVQAADGQRTLTHRLLGVAINAYVFEGELCVSKTMYDICKERRDQLQSENDQLRKENLRLLAENNRLRRRTPGNANCCPTLDSCAIL